jgi:hypothetical protein
VAAHPAPEPGERGTEMSNRLDDIIAKQHGATNVMVVFLDVLKYSLRKSVIQQRIINAFKSGITTIL